MATAGIGAEKTGSGLRQPGDLGDEAFAGGAVETFLVGLGGFARPG